MSADSGWPGSATFTFAVRQPDATAIWCARCGPTAGTVTFTGMSPRTAAGQPAVAASSAQASQRAHSRGPYSANGENSPQPAGPSISAPSRTVMPRNLVCIGIANARTPGSRSVSRSRSAAAFGPVTHVRVPALLGFLAHVVQHRRVAGKLLQAGRPVGEGVQRALEHPQRQRRLL